MDGISRDAPTIRVLSHADSSAIRAAHQFPTFTTVLTGAVEEVRQLRALVYAATTTHPSSLSSTEAANDVGDVQGSNGRHMEAALSVHAALQEQSLRVSAERTHTTTNTSGSKGTGSVAGGGEYDAVLGLLKRVARGGGDGGDGSSCASRLPMMACLCEALAVTVTVSAESETGSSSDNINRTAAAVERRWSLRWGRGQRTELAAMPPRPCRRPIPHSGSGATTTASGYPHGASAGAVASVAGASLTAAERSKKRVTVTLHAHNIFHGLPVRQAPFTRPSSHSHGHSRMVSEELRHTLAAAYRAAMTEVVAPLLLLLPTTTTTSTDSAAETRARGGYRFSLCLNYCPPLPGRLLQPSSLASATAASPSSLPPTSTGSTLALTGMGEGYGGGVAVTAFPPAHIDTNNAGSLFSVRAESGVTAATAAAAASRAAEDIIRGFYPSVLPTVHAANSSGVGLGHSRCRCSIAGHGNGQQQQQQQQPAMMAVMLHSPMEQKHSSRCGSDIGGLDNDTAWSHPASGRHTSSSSSAVAALKPLIASWLRPGPSVVRRKRPRVEREEGDCCSGGGGGQPLAYAVFSAVDESHIVYTDPLLSAPVATATTAGPRGGGGGCDDKAWRHRRGRRPVGFHPSSSSAGGGTDECGELMQVALLVVDPTLLDHQQHQLQEMQQRRWQRRPATSSSAISVDPVIHTFHSRLSRLVGSVVQPRLPISSAVVPFPGTQPSPTPTPQGSPTVTVIALPFRGKITAAKPLTASVTTAPATTTIALPPPPPPPCPPPSRLRLGFVLDTVAGATSGSAAHALLVKPWAAPVAPTRGDGGGSNTPAATAAAPGGHYQVRLSPAALLLSAAGPAAVAPGSLDCWDASTDTAAAAAGGGGIGSRPLRTPVLTLPQAAPPAPSLGSAAADTARARGQLPAAVCGRPAALLPRLFARQRRLLAWTPPPPQLEQQQRRRLTDGGDVSRSTTAIIDVAGDAVGGDGPATALPAVGAATAVQWCEKFLVLVPSGNNSSSGSFSGALERFATREAANTGGEEDEEGGATATTTTTTTACSSSFSGNVVKQRTSQNGSPHHPVAAAAVWWVADQHAVHERLRLEFFCVFAEAFVLHPELAPPPPPPSSYGGSSGQMKDSSRPGDDRATAPDPAQLLRYLAQVRALLDGDGSSSSGTAGRGASNGSGCSNSTNDNGFAPAVAVPIPADLIALVSASETALRRWGWRFWHLPPPPPQQPSRPFSARAAAPISPAVGGVAHWPRLRLEGFELRLNSMEDLRAMAAELAWHVGPSSSSSQAASSSSSSSSSSSPRSSSAATVPAVVPSAVLRFLVSRSCRGAIMFGDALAAPQVARLLGDLRGVQQFYLCSHGRPSFVRLADKRRN